MKILIDGDSCRVLNITERVAKQYDVPCHIYCNTTCSVNTNISSVHIVDCDRDAADFAIVNACCENDIVITNDSGLAAMVLAKNGIALNASGAEYTNQNIMQYLNRRYTRQTARRKSNRKQVKGCIYENDKTPINYKATLIKLITTPHARKAAHSI